LKDFILVRPPGTSDARPRHGSPLELTDRERELILKHSFAPDELTRQLRILPPPGQAAVVRCTLDDLDDLAGCVASKTDAPAFSLSFLVLASFLSASISKRTLAGRM
jgi:hypothetical protein